MLHIVRNWITGWLAIVIVALLIIPFAFWGISYYFGQGGDVNALTVNGTKINLQQYQRAYQTLRQQWQAALGGRIPAEQEAALKQRTVDSLIERELLKQINASIGLWVNNVQLKETIKSLQPFQGEDGFDTNLYTRAISQLGLSPAAFEQQMRQDMLSEQLQSALIESVFVARTDIEQLAQLENQTRNIDYAVLSSDALKESMVITDDDIHQYYQAHTNFYMEPEKIRIAYIDLSLDRIAADIPVQEDELQSYYNSNRENYDVAEQRKVKQLFFKTGKDAAQEQINRGMAKARKLADLARSGTSFEDIAEQHADDPGPELEMSEHGFMTRGIMEPEVDKVMFNMKEGDISDPIQTKNGIYVLKLEKITGGTANTFENVRDQVEKDYRHNRAETRFFDLADKLATLAYEHPDTLDVAAEEIAIQVQESGFFSRQQQDDALLQNPRIISAAFSDDVLLNGNNSEPIEIGDNRVVVLRVTEHLPEKKKPLQEVRERIITRLKYERARRENQDRGATIIKALRNNVSRDEVAVKYNFEWQHKTAVKRDDVQVNRSVLRTAFRLGRPQPGKPLYGGNLLGSGDYAVVIVNEVNDAETGTLKDEELVTIRDQLQKQLAADTWTRFMRDLKEQADIHVYSKNL
ncbi:MAG: SurA N-terminal domain-containing protein [Gammaproteobacteria bacterium]